MVTKREKKRGGYKNRDRERVTKTGIERWLQKEG
tara:strand:- start:401 stop:502 length:102 start_codon:yes stop_codon:yes gene_type:complete